MVAGEYYHGTKCFLGLAAVEFLRFWYAQVKFCGTVKDKKEGDSPDGKVRAEVEENG